MRLYLSSFRIGDHPQVLRELVDRSRPEGPRRAVLVGAALDGLAEPVRAERMADEAQRLADQGFEVTELDLRDPGQLAGMPELLAGADLLWLRGGNAFVLSHQLRASGLDGLILAALDADQLVVGGYSAGPCVLGPSLLGIELCDDPSEVPRTFGVPAGHACLGVLPTHVVPHIDTPGHPESAALDQVLAGHRIAGRPAIGLRDGDVLVVDGGLNTLQLLPKSPAAKGSPAAISR